MYKIKLDEKKFTTIILIFIILLAFWIRLRGISFGLPLITHTDEPKIMGRAIKIANTGKLNPNFFKYPSAYIYMQAALIKIVLAVTPNIKLTKLNINTRSILYYHGRFLTLILSIFTIFLTFWVATLLFTRLIGLFSSLFLSLSFLHITNSYVITVDNPMVFWLLLGFLASVLLFKRGPKLKYYLLNAVFIGFSIGTKYTGIIGIVPLIVGHFHHFPISIKGIFHKKLMITAIVLVLAFILTTPYSLLDFQKFIGDVKYEGKHYSKGHIGQVGGPTSYGKYYQFLIKDFGFFFFSLALLGIFILIWQKNNKLILLLSFPILFFIFVGSYKVNFSRNILALLPFLSIFSGYASVSTIMYPKRNIDKYVRERGKTKIFINLIVLSAFCVALCISFVHQMNKSIKFTGLLTLPNTRWIATKWINSNIPKGSRLALEHYTPRPNKQLFRIKYLGICGLCFKKHFKKFDYIISSNHDYNRFFINRKKYPKEVKYYQNLFKKYPLIKKFVSDRCSSIGPTIKIYKIEKQ